LLAVVRGLLTSSYEPLESLIHERTCLSGITDMTVASARP
jgi:hypothetical protein